MAVTNGWGQGVINNTNGWGKLATNNIGAGSVYENSASGDTVLVAPSAPSFASTQSFNFDGVDDFIEANLDGTASGGILAASDSDINLSISFWFASQGNNNNKGIISWGNHMPDGFPAFFFVQQIFQSGQRKIQVSADGASYRGTVDISNTDGVWHHVLITRTSSDNSWRGFLNGSSSAWFTYDDGGSITYRNFAEKLYIGAGYVPYYSGNIDEVSIFNSVQNAATIYGTGVPNDISSLNPVAWYRCGENANYKSPQWLMTENSNKDKVSNYSYQFDGVNDFVTVNDDASLKVVTANHSLSFWMKTTDGSTQVLSEKGSSDELAAWVVSNKIRWAGPNTLNSSTDVNDGNWKHIVFVADGSSSFIYINGSLDATGSTKIQASANSSNYVFGARSGGSFAFDGQLDQIAIFNRALSSTEVSALYNSGTVTTLPSGAVAHYKLGEEATFSTNWTIPDQVGSNDGTSSNMTIEDRIGDSPNSSSNAVSFNMVEADRQTDVPT